jgi:hypothetical protein
VLKRGVETRGPHGSLRLWCRSTRVVSLALSLTEALVKNCGRDLHQEVATPKFMAQMARIARTYSERTGRENLEVADKVCGSPTTAQHSGVARTV